MLFYSSRRSFPGAFVAQWPIRLWMQVDLTESKTDFLLLRLQAKDLLPHDLKKSSVEDILSVLHLVVAAYEAKTPQKLEGLRGKGSSQTKQCPRVQAFSFWGKCFGVCMRGSCGLWFYDAACTLSLSLSERVLGFLHLNPFCYPGNIKLPLYVHFSNACLKIVCA